MLLNRATADGIAGGTIRIDDVVEHPAGYRVTEAQARAAGYRGAAVAHAELDRRSAEHVYVTTVSYAGPDERPALAADDALTADDVAVISERLARFDAASGKGPWTRRYLELIRDNEGVRAPDLAAREGLDVPRFKRRVRQLKGLEFDDQPGRGIPNLTARHDFPAADPTLKSRRK